MILIEGPTTGVPRQVVPLKRVEVTKFLVKTVLRNQKSGILKKKLEEFKLNEKWASTSRAQRVVKQARREQLTDFERFKVVTLRRTLGRHLRKWTNEKRQALLKSAAKK